MSKWIIKGNLMNGEFLEVVVEDVPILDKVRYINLSGINGIIDNLLQGEDPPNRFLAGRYVTPEPNPSDYVFTVAYSRIFITLTFLDGEVRKVKRASSISPHELSLIRCEPQVFRYYDQNNSVRIMGDIDWNRFELASKPG